jgi:predicted ATPase
VEAHHALWPTLSAMGQPTAAVVHMERGLALYDRDRHASQTFLYGGHDPGACCRYHLGITYWLLGRPDQALRAARDALRLAGELNHPLTVTIATWFGAWVQYQRGEREAVAAHVARLRTLIAEFGFATWSDLAIVLSPASSGERPTAEVVADVHRQLMALRSVPPWRKLFSLSVLAALCVDAGQPDKGREALAAIAEKDRSTFCSPEVHRIEGELLLQSPTRASDEAQRCFEKALRLSRERGEKSLELRAAMSLARLWERQGKRDDARRLLTEVYGWFTEGFATADLRTAKQMLEDLSEGPALN